MPRARVPQRPPQSETASDPLSLYNKKRRFDVTPEPPGDLAPRKDKGLSFVIQKHAASRLHYDFRLEIDGYLKSWSVPKGPSLDPAQKRLAVETENHPLSYGGFEGIIPEAEYGGGTVLVWDNGTWEPVGDAAKDLAAGHLKFVLRGHKLRGRYALVRLGGKNRYGQDGRSWLLVKDRDAFARPESAGLITEEEPYSVLSGRDLAEIAQARERVWHSNRGRPDAAKLHGVAERPMPAAAPPWTRPRLARRGQVPAGDAWWHERLVLGRQVNVCLDNGRVRFYDRPRGAAPAPHREEPGLTAWWCERLEAALSSLPIREAWWEGVVTSIDDAGGTHPLAPTERPSSGSVVLFVTDASYLDGYVLDDVPYEARKGIVTAWLALLPPEMVGHVRVIDHVSGRGREVLEAARRLHFEGLVSKRRDFCRGENAAIHVLFLEP
jgi:bifunctional non-homologous end joining protein LigD